MKLNELLLLELSERIERHGNYGQWIDTKAGKAYPIVNHEGHQKMAAQLLPALNYPMEPGDDTFESAYKNGFVRVVHSDNTEVDYTGFAESLKKAHPIIMSSAAQEDVEMVYIDVIENTGTPTWTFSPVKQETFNMMKNKPADITNFLRTL